MLLGTPGTCEVGSGGMNDEELVIRIPIKCSTVKSLKSISNRIKDSMEGAVPLALFWLTIVSFNIIIGYVGGMLTDVVWNNWQGGCISVLFILSLLWIWAGIDIIGFKFKCVGDEVK